MPELTRVGRVFGNATEYLPAGMAALAVLAIVGVGAWFIHLIGALLVFGRVAHAYGLSRNAGTSPGRAVGVGLTFLAFVLAGVALVVHAFI